MIAYFEKFPDKSATELRTVRFFEGSKVASIPTGTYVFTEFYCDDLTCHCQRVLIKIFRVSETEDPPEEIATISFTWNEELDESWEEILDDVDNPFLDPFHFQAAYAEDLLEFWYDMYQNDSDYAERIERHYYELRHLPGVIQKGHLTDTRFMATSDEKAEDLRKRRRLLQRRNVKTKPRRK